MLKRRTLLGMIAGAPAIAFFRASPFDAMERNVLDMTVPEFLGRLKPTPDGTFHVPKDHQLLIVKHPNDRAVLLAAEAQVRDLEMYENDVACANCGSTTFRYRWLKNTYGDAIIPTHAWYCVCGYEIGAE